MLGGGGGGGGCASVSRGTGAHALCRGGGAGGGGGGGARGQGTSSLFCRGLWRLFLFGSQPITAIGVAYAAPPSIPNFAL